MKWNWPVFKWNAITVGIVCHSPSGYPYICIQDVWGYPVSMDILITKH